MAERSGSAVKGNGYDPKLTKTFVDGIEKVLANFEIRPPQADGQKPTDIQIAAAKQLARDLAEARVIEEPVGKKIIDELSKPAP